MKKVVNDLRLMIKACDMYYNENLSQQEIASALNLSRPTLSRLLTGAREQKLIRIEVADVEFVKYWEISEKLKEKYNLKDVLIADSDETDEGTKRNIGTIEAAYLGHLIRDEDVVGISMGSTLHRVVMEMYCGLLLFINSNLILLQLMLRISLTLQASIFCRLFS